MKNPCNTETSTESGSDHHTQRYHEEWGAGAELLSWDGEWDT